MVRRRNALWWAAMLHRVSGLLLATFLPVHFLTLGSVLSSQAALDGILNWTAQPMVKAGEIGLVFLLSVHLAGGLRVMALEMLPWRDGQKTLAGVVVGVSLLAGLAFLLRAV